MRTITCLHEPFGDDRYGSCMENISLLDLLFLLLIVALLARPLRLQYLRLRRAAIVRSFEQARSSVVITIIHKQQSSLTSLFSGEYITSESSEKFLRELRRADPAQPVDIILHTTGGALLAAEQIAFALRNHTGPTTVFVPYYAFSGGTLIALAADKIVMGANAFLGRIDPQIIGVPASSLIYATDTKQANASDTTLILGDVARKALQRTANTLTVLLAGRGYTPEAIERLARELVSGIYTHDHPLTLADAAALSLPVDGNMPEDMYRLVSLVPTR